jgi:hypothetical protein
MRRAVGTNLSNQRFKERSAAKRAGDPNDTLSAYSILR